MKFPLKTKGSEGDCFPASNLVVEVSSVCTQVVPEGDGSIQRINAEVEGSDALSHDFITKGALENKVSIG